MAASPRPASLSLPHLSAAVAKAVDEAAQKHKVTVINKMAIGPGVIMGPYLRLEGSALQNAAAVAEHVTAAANQAIAGAAGAQALAGHTPLVPGFTVWDHVIICGFWPGPWPVLENVASRE